MSPTATQQWILAEKPTGVPVLSGPRATFQLVTKPLPQLKEGQVLIKILHISNDPAQRLWIDPAIPANRLYTKPVEVGDTMKSLAVAEVIQSKAEVLPVGTLISAMAGWCEYAVIAAEECIPFRPVEGLSVTDCTALFGAPGVTALYGLVDIAHTGPNDAIVISGAAGAVGSVAVQIAKHVLKCRKVIGIAGSDAKCKWVESLGADVCLNYKSSGFENELKKAADGFVEVYFDNVGGWILDLMLKLLQKEGRVIACGAIAVYNNNTAGIKNWYHVIAMRLQIKGFVVLDALPTGRWAQIVDTLVKEYEEGNIKATKEGVTLVPAKFEDVPKIWMRLFEGQGTGKLLTQVV
ncbi:quinone oxidoreductase [Paecilomyces lecythidis]|uniref:Quinone oxidoreductase n=1 Tax=Paecilomyces lecythidis TaxID=3004212 RepID=A0ABR3XPV4_9EURO